MITEIDLLTTKFMISKLSKAESELLRLQLQRRIEAANQIVRKQEQERNQLIQQLTQLDTEI